MCDRDGVERSGVFVAASCLVERIKLDREVDVFQSVKQMRLNRSQLICNMVRVQNNTSQTVSKIFVEIVK